MEKTKIEFEKSHALKIIELEEMFHKKMTTEVLEISESSKN
jgi:hypothetical protein